MQTDDYLQVTSCFRLSAMPDDRHSRLQGRQVDGVTIHVCMTFIMGPDYLVATYQKRKEAAALISSSVMEDF